MIKYSTDTFGPTFSDTVLAELDVRFSRATVAISATEQELPFGLILLKKDDDTYAPLTETAATGEGENATPAKLDGEACAVLLQTLPSSESSQTGLVLRGFAIINGSNLVWDASVKDKKAALAQLEKHNFIIENIAEA